MINSKSNNNNFKIINITLQSNNYIVLTNYKQKIINFLKIKKINYFLNYLPKKTKRYYILRSPHVYKKSIEAFEENLFIINFRIIINNSTNYLNLFYFLKFLKNNIPLIINIKIKLKNNVKTTLL